MQVGATKGFSVSFLSPAAMGIAVLLDDGGVKFLPILDVVQIDRAGQNTAVILETCGTEDFPTRRVSVHVSENRHVVMMDVRLGQSGTGLLCDPLFELRIGRPTVLDERYEGVGIQAKGRAGHGVEAFAHCWVAWVDFTHRIEADFLPEAREVKGAEWAGDSTANHGDVVHVMCCVVMCCVVARFPSSYIGISRSQL